MALRMKHVKQMGTITSETLRTLVKQMDILKVSLREVPKLPELLLFETVHRSLLIPVTVDTHYPEDCTENKTPPKRPRHKALSCCS